MRHLSRPRNCIGLRFALTEIKIALVRVLHRFTFWWSKESPAEIILNPISPTARPDSILRVASRGQDRNNKNSSSCMWFYCDTETALHEFAVRCKKLKKVIIFFKKITIQSLKLSIMSDERYTLFIIYMLWHFEHEFKETETGDSLWRPCSWHSK
jgi:hypothetical protein